MIKHLDEFKSNVYSQNGEDGVVEEILKRLEIDKGTFCEFGAADGVWLSNTYRLLEKEWRGVMIEGSDSYEKLKETAQKHHPNLIAIQKYVQAEGEDSLDNILKDTFLEEDFDVLSIDVDSCDYQIWKGLVNYRPKIVIIEIVSSIQPTEKVIYPESYGTSFLPMLELGREKRYSLVCHTGNMIFVRNDLAAGKFLEGVFCWNWLR